MNFSNDKPTKTALYLVDRGMQGKAYRFYNADTEQWGMCGYDMNDALEGKDNHSTFDTVGFFPWVGPLTGPNLKLDRPLIQIEEPSQTKEPKPKKVAKKMAKQSGANAKLVITKVGNTKVGSIVKSSGKTIHPDGTVFYREDRQKWVAMANGKQEAARPTAEACLAFLKKKYNIDGIVLK
jgi:hypothetical protein